MTRPIYEPTPARTDARLGFSAAQLFRRPAPPSGGATYSWARRRVYAQSNQSITSGSEVNVTLNDFQTSDAAMFQAYDSGSADGITPKVGGLFGLWGRIYWNQWPGAHQVIINGIDPDAFAGYPFYGSDGDDTLAVAFGATIRLAANQHLYMTVYQESGVAKTLYGGSGAGGGTFFELQFLGDIDLDDRDWS